MTEKNLKDYTVADYRNLLKWHDWTYRFSDYHPEFIRGKREEKLINQLRPLLDPDSSIYNEYCPNGI